MPRQRDYKAEYRRRIERGRARQLSDAQARGHPTKGEPLASNVGRLPKSDEALNAAILHMHRGEGLGSAARKAGVSDKRLRRYLKLHNMAQRKGQTWRLFDKRPYRALTRSEGQVKKIIVSGYEAAALAGSVWNAQTRSLSDQNRERLAAFEGGGLTDVNGRFHPFETDLNTIYRLANAETDAFPDLYSNVI